MDNKPTIMIFGESKGNKKGAKVKGFGGNLYTGRFNVELHGVEMEGVAIKNDNGSTANMSDIKTDSPILNTGNSSLTLRRTEIFLKGKKMGVIVKIIFTVVATLIASYLTYKFGWN